MRSSVILKSAEGGYELAAHGLLNQIFKKNLIIININNISETSDLILTASGPIGNVENCVEERDWVGGPPVANSKAPPTCQLIRHCVDTLNQRERH